MKPYISQTLESNSCGAHSIAYYLWETNKAQSINEKTFVANIHKKIQVGPNDLDIPEIYSSPEKMVTELSNSWHSYAYTCVLSNSPLMPIAKGLNISSENINVLDQVKNGDNKYAIMFTSIGHLTQALHYMLIKYENNTFKLLDSLYGVDHVVWEEFIPEANGKLTLDRNSAYFYTGAGILIE